MASTTRADFTLPHEPKPIIAASFTPDDHDLPKLAPLIFAHGAGGGMDADGVANFRDGLATKRKCVCFKGNINLGSRVKMFKTLVEHENAIANEALRDCAPVLGGRSMGARAAVIAATELIEEGDEDDPASVIDHLVLVSYPLQDAKENVRDQILLDLPARLSVLFISGDNDSMCDIAHLRTIRGKMKCKTWMATVLSANHGMDVKPKRGTVEVGRMTGLVAAAWLGRTDASLTKTETEIFWDDEEEVAKRNDWHSPEEAIAEDGKARQASKRKAPSGETYQVERKGGSVKTPAGGQEVRRGRKTTTDTDKNIAEEGISEHKSPKRTKTVKPAPTGKKTKDKLTNDNEKPQDQDMISSRTRQRRKL